MMKTAMLITVMAFTGLMSCPASADTPTDSQPAKTQDKTWKSYDLSALHPYAGEEREGEEPLSLFPFNPFVRFLRGDVELGHVDTFRLEKDLVRDMLAHLLGDELFERDTVQMDLNDSNLMVKAPEEIHLRIEKILSFLKNRLNRNAVLDLEIFTAEDGSFPASADAAAVRRASMEGRLKPILSRSMTLTLGNLVEISSGETRFVVWDYEPEIAQNSVVCEPQVEALHLGVRWLARPLVAPDNKSLLLGLYTMASRLAEPMKTRDGQYGGRLILQERTEKVPVGQALDDPQIEFASLATVVFLPPGKTSVVSVSFPHSSGMGSLVMLLSARLIPMEAQIETEKGMIFSCFDFSHLQAKELFPLTHFREDPLSWDWTWVWKRQETLPLTLTLLGSEKRLVCNYVYDLVEQMLNMDYDRLEESYPEDMERDRFILGDQVFFPSTPAFQKEFNALARGLSSSVTPYLDVDISFLEVAGHPLVKEAAKVLSMGEQQGGVSLNMMHGTSATAIAGLERLMIYDYDVDVAQNAAIPNPNPAGYLDGAYLHIRHEPGLVPGRGEDLVRAMICVNRLKGVVDSKNLGANGSVLGYIDQPVFDKGYMDTSFKADGQPYIVGALTLEEGRKSRTLYVIGRAEPISVME